jgi:uncharacterized protein (DUF433 family)
MIETTADMQTIVRRLGLLQEQLQELQSLLSSHVVRGPAGAVSEHPYITRVEAILGGEPIIKGTRKPVRAVAEHWKFGDAPEEIARKLPHLHLAQIFDALSYYDDHRDQIEGTIALNRVPVDDRARREGASAALPHRSPSFFA